MRAHYRISAFFAALLFLAGNAALAQQNPLEPGGEDPPADPGIVNKNGPDLVPKALKEFNENFAPWLHPSNLMAEGLPLPAGSALWELTGGRERVRALSNKLGQWQRQEMEEAKAFAKRADLPLVLENPHSMAWYNWRGWISIMETDIPSPSGFRRDGGSGAWPAGLSRYFQCGSGRHDWNR